MTDEKKNARERIPEELKETAQQVWYAGLGALSTAEKEGGKLFRKLVDTGRSLDRKVREELNEGAEEGSSLFRRFVEASERLETRVLDEAEERFGPRFGEARERVEATWTDVESKLKHMVDEAMDRLGGASEEEAEADEPVAVVPEEAAPAAVEPGTPEGGSETVEKTLGREGSPALVTLRPVGGGWYEIEKNGQVVDKVQGKENAHEAMKAYL